MQEEKYEIKNIHVQQLKINKTFKAWNMWEQYEGS